MLRTVWTLVKDTVAGFIEDGALSRGAAIAYYTIFALAPVLVIAIAIAGLAFGADAARGAIAGQLSGLMGKQSADAVQSMIAGAGNHGAGVLATVLGVGTLLVTASGVFGEMQSALNMIWRVQPDTSQVSRLVRARLLSLGLVATLGFLLMVSLVVSAALTALDHTMRNLFPGIHLLLGALNFAVSFVLITALFAAIYRFLPDKPLTWRDVIVGAAATALLFTIGKTLIGLYLGSSSMATSYGSAASFVIVLLWIYYSAQIFLLGAEFTRAFAHRHGSHAPAAARAKPPADRAATVPARIHAAHGALPQAAAPAPPGGVRAALALLGLIGGLRQKA